MRRPRAAGQADGVGDSGDRTRALAAEARGAFAAGLSPPPAPVATMAELRGGGIHCLPATAACAAGTQGDSDCPMTLKPHQKALLAGIVRGGGRSASEVDGRSLAPLVRAGLVRIDAGRVVPTRAGRRVATASGPPLDRVRLNAGQEGLLRVILRERRVPAEELDGRVVRPLIARGLVTLSEDDVVTPTSAGRVYFEGPPAPARRRGRKASPEVARAAAIRRAARRLEAAVPPGAEVMVGGTRASADDLVDAFLRHARDLEQAP